MISMDKQYKTRDGRAVRLLCIDGPGRFPVVGIVGQYIYSWKDNGLTQSGIMDHDLIEVKKTSVIKGVIFYYINSKGGLVAESSTHIVTQNAWRSYFMRMNRKFTETPFEREVEIPG